jgi:phage anti-repressor protein
MGRITLKNFLKKYTAISIKFIDEYYKFYELCENEKFGIPLDDIIDYLDIQNVERFYENFRKKYKIKIDYIITRIKIKKEKDVRNAIYYISFDTFEKICMVSKSEKANKVRDYFIILRKFIDYYKDHIDKMILTKAEKYGSIYILLINKDKNIFKLGYSNNIRKRLQTYATGRDTHPSIQFIMLINNPLNVEKCSKIFLNKYQFKEGKEIYKIDLNIMKEIVDNCSNIVNNINNYKKTDAYIVYDEKEYLDENSEVYAYERK